MKQHTLQRHYFHQRNRVFTHLFNRIAAFLLLSVPLVAADLSAFLGERLDYDLYYRGFNTVDSRMWIEQEDSLTFTIIWTVETRPLWGLLFNINNRYETVVHSASQQLLETRKCIDQKNIQQQWHTIYDWDENMAITNQKHRWPVRPKAHNVLWLLYDLRQRRLTPGDSLRYLLDVESQLWQLRGIVPQANESTADIIIDFEFSPARPIQPRAWKTDLLTNRLARDRSRLIIHMSPAPERVPQRIRFGSDDEEVEMILRHRVSGR